MVPIMNELEKNRRTINEGRAASFESKKGDGTLFLRLERIEGDSAFVWNRDLGGEVKKMNAGSSLELKKEFKVFVQEVRRDSIIITHLAIH